MIHNMDLLLHILKIFEWFVICTTIAGHMANGGLQVFGVCSTFGFLDPSDFQVYPLDSFLRFQTFKDMGKSSPKLIVR